MKQEYAQYLLNKTREDYNKIAEDFSRTRSFMWKDLKPFIEYSISGDKVLDLGCGNGRLYPHLQQGVEYIGVDNSEKLIEIAKQAHPNAKFQVTDGLSIPFQDNSFDKIYCIAVLHHIPSKKLRQEFLQEAKRVLKSKGVLILTVWKLGQKQSIKLFLKYTFLKLIGRSKLDFGDILVPWAKDCERYIHNFSERGLRQLIKKTGFKIEKIGTLWRPEKRNANVYTVAIKK